MAVAVENEAPGVGLGAILLSVMRLILPKKWLIAIV
jgi:hypothetical protein